MKDIWKRPYGMKVIWIRAGGVLTSIADGGGDARGCVPVISGGPDDVYGIKEFSATRHSSGDC